MALLVPCAQQAPAVPPRVEERLEPRQATWYIDFHLELIFNTEAGKIQGNLQTWDIPQVQNHKVPWGNYAVTDEDGPIPAVGTKAYKQYMPAMIQAHPDQFPKQLQKIPQPSVQQIEQDPKLASFTDQRQQCQRCHVGVREREKRGDMAAPSMPTAKNNPSCIPKHTCSSPMTCITSSRAGQGIRRAACSARIATLHWICMVVGIFPAPLDETLAFATYYDMQDGYLLTSRGNPFGNVVKDGDKVILHSATGNDFVVPILKDIKLKKPWNDQAAMGAMSRVKAHAQHLECYACHASWVPQC